jgi:hypothetical protein
MREKCMKLLALAFAMSVSAPVLGEETKSLSPQPLQLRPKGALATVANPAPTVSPKNAPFVSVQAATAPEPGLDLVSPRSQASSQAKPGCSKAASLCYEADTGRIVFKPARQFMPDIPGLQRENISLKRDRIIFRYSF